MPDRRPLIVTIGSVHTDLIASVPRLPSWGETLRGTGFISGLGGKAGNQAIAVARCGGGSMILGRVGDDPFGEDLRATLVGSGVDCALLGTDSDAATGASTVLAGRDGEYASVIIPGASERLGPSEIDAARSTLSAASLLLAQLEIPVETTIAAASIARAGGARLMVNASPLESATDFPDALRAVTDILIVNQREAAVLTGSDPETSRSAEASARIVRERLGIAVVVVTRGGDGAAASDSFEDSVVAGHDVSVVDTVGAGDAFAGALAVELARNVTLAEALPFANAAGAIAVTRSGGAASLPDRAEIEAFLLTASTPPP